MNQLLPADVANLRCRFVSDLYKYFKCQKYSIGCCEDEALTSFLKYKLASSTCILDDSAICTLNNYKKKTQAVTCGVDVPCAAQAHVIVKNTGSDSVFIPSIINADFGNNAPLFSAQGEITLVSNTLYQDAKLTVGIIDQNLNIIDTTEFSTGSAFVQGTGVVSSPNYSLRTMAFFAMPDLVNLPGPAYMKEMRIYYTNNVGQFVPNQFWDINVNPTTSPYRVCGTCTPVTISDLYFASPNWSVAMKTMMDNAIRVLTGSANNIDSLCSTSFNKPTLFTGVKHLPNSTWTGFNTADFRFKYWDGTSDKVVTQSFLGPAYHALPGNMYGIHTFNLPCADKIVEMPNAAMNLNGIINQATTKFNELKLSSNKTINTGTLNGTDSLFCSSDILQATIVTNHVVTLVEWLNNLGVVVGTGYTFVVPAFGDYTCRVTLDSGCILDTVFTVSAGGISPFNLATEDELPLLTENNINIII